jgi:N-acetylmuramoyl-L-alanine amidase
VKELVQRYGVTRDRVVGHSDIAPQRKTDPGPQFPWKQFADAGLAVWPDPARVQAAQQRLAGSVPELPWFQQRLAQVGYGVPRTEALDEPMRRVIAAFQMHFRPARFDGEPDAETAALLSALTGEPAPEPGPRHAD